MLSVELVQQRIATGKKGMHANEAIYAMLVSEFGKDELEKFVKENIRENVLVIPVLVTGLSNQKPPNRFKVIEAVVQLDRDIPNRPGRIQLVGLPACDVGEYNPAGSRRQDRTNKIVVFFDNVNVANLSFPLAAKIYLRGL